MSGETLITGSLRFKKGIPEEEELGILGELAEIIEVDMSDLKYDGRCGEWAFRDTNWQSHIEWDRVKAFFELHKSKFMRFVCSLYYLVPDEEIAYSYEGSTNRKGERGGSNPSLCITGHKACNPENRI